MIHIVIRCAKFSIFKNSKRKVQGMPQSQAAALPRRQEEEESDKTKTSANRTNVRKALRLALSLPLARFVCVEVLRPSQPSGVMSSAVSLPNHTFTGQA